uniref:catenin delta-2-like n=1 Tax=Ciona intestinalis TaxID=7719 RepID=UPI00089DB40F|nr:catenin delta-2-like [Ciona intestinalis]|eukprot:XP_018668797.1 catenin delta-2-like [Ciona intestinalis]
MSHDRKYVNAYSGQGDTEFILASVKEQEIQFEKLTRELEEEHITVANQLEQFRVKSPEAFNYRPEENEREISDTESKQGSSLDRVETSLPNGTKRYDSDCAENQVINDRYYTQARQPVEAKMLYSQAYLVHQRPYSQYPYHANLVPHQSV